MSELLSLRLKFTRMLAEFILWIPQAHPGYAVVFEEVKRGAAQVAWNVAHGVGIGKSLHTWGLAGDLSLYINGEYQTNTEAYRPLGEKWESMGGTWGGRFKDGNHFSLSYQGIK